MGLFKSKEEKKKKAEKNIVFIGDSLQSIGKIPNGSSVGISFVSEKSCLKLHHNDINITLPYERIISFKIDNEVNLVKNKPSLGKAIVGGALFGVAGAIVGGTSGKGNTEIKWIADLSFKTKTGEIKELFFIERSLTGYYNKSTKSYSSQKFEELLNDIISDYSEDITEL